MTNYNALIITVPHGLSEDALQSLVGMVRLWGGAITYDTRQYLEPPEGSPYASLPSHGFLMTEDGEADRHCRWCGQDPKRYWGSYDEYLEWWGEHEWEGDPAHKPESREWWEYTNATCSVG